MRELSHVEEAVVAGVEANCAVFLRKAAEEMAGHDDQGDPPFDEARAAIVTVMIQTAIELATVARIIRNDGIAAVLRGAAPATESDLEDRWRQGELSTLTFSQMKPRVAHIVPDEDFWGVVDDFQVARNKLVHFHRPADSASLYDLKYESAFLLLHTVSRLLWERDDYDTPEHMANIIGPDVLRRLLAFSPYRARIERLARDYSEEVLACIMCGAPTYARDELKCMACGWDDPIRLADCPLCDTTSAVFYDHLNLVRFRRPAVAEDEREHKAEQDDGADPVEGSAAGVAQQWACSAHLNFQVAASDATRRPSQQTRRRCPWSSGWRRA